MIFGIGAEVTDAFKLAAETGFHIFKGRFHEAGDDLEGFGIEIILVVLIFGDGVGIGDREEPVIDPCFGFHGVWGGDPVDGAFDFSAVGCIPAACGGIVGAVDGGDVAVCVLIDGCAGDKVCAAEADFFSGGEAVELFYGFFHKVIAFDVEFAGEGNLAAAGFGIFGIVDDFHFLGLTCRIVVDDQFYGVHDSHSAGCCFVQIFPDAEIQQGDIGQTVEFCDADLFAEIPDRFRRHASAAERADRRHTGIVPSGNVVIFDQFQQFAFAHNGVGQRQTGELDLAGIGRRFKIFDEPVVKGTVDLEFKRTDRVGDPFNGIFQRMGEVIKGIDAPFAAGIVVIRMTDPVDRRVAHVHVRMSHIDFGAENFAAIGKLTVLHTLKEIQVFFHSAVAVGTGFAGGRQIAFVILEFIIRQFADICLSLLDEGDWIYFSRLKLSAKIFSHFSRIKPVIH